LPARGNRGFGQSSVSGLKRIPLPPAKIKAQGISVVDTVLPPCKRIRNPADQSLAVLLYFSQFIGIYPPKNEYFTSFSVMLPYDGTCTEYTESRKNEALWKTKPPKEKPWSFA
jgi:hypothetical protein